MQLVWLEARDFRNYREVRVELGPGLTAVAGPNGQGKTNLLEAMYYLCSLVSPRVSSDLPLVRAGADVAILRGEVVTSGSRLLIEVEIRGSGQNRVQVNRSSVRRKRDLRRQARAVFSGPDDLAIVLGDPGERRRFMDEAVVANWPAKDGVAPAYERTLRQRNRLLKDWEGQAASGGPPGLEGWDAELIANGVALTELRAEAIERIRLRAAGEFEALAGPGGGTLIVAYQASVSGDSLADSFVAALAARRADELIRRTTLVGPHRDDLGLVVQDLAARGFASHGEAWGAAVALKLALAAALATEIGEDPMVFLDDPFSGLDPTRRERLAGGLAEHRQVIMSVPDRAQVPPGAAVLGVEGGSVAEE
jgi:DNA replication and repair protein RecF